MEQSVSSIPENTEDYYCKDGLLYCGKCHTPREAFFAKGIALMGKNKHPIECICQRTEREKQETLDALRIMREEREQKAKEASENIRRLLNQK